MQPAPVDLDAQQLFETHVAEMDVVTEVVRVTARTAAWTASPWGAGAIDNVEFLQGECVNSGNFMGLGKERDPLVALQDTPAPGCRRCGSSCCR